MKLNELLSEAIVKRWASKKMALSTAIKMLNEHCKDGLKAVSNGGLLFRGDYSVKSDFELKDSSTGERTSRHYSNAYQLMMNASPALANYPKRTKSFICSSDFATVWAYGTPTVVIPYDGTTIAVSDTHDFVDQKIHSKLFPSGIKISDFTDNFAGIVPEINKKKVTIDELNASLKKANPDDVIEYWRRYISRLDDVDALKKILRRPEPFTALSAELMSPKSLDLTLMKFGDKLPEEKECWFSGQAVFIKFGVFKDILYALQEQGYPIYQPYANLLRKRNDDDF